MKTLFQMILIVLLNFAEKALTSLSHIFPFSYLMKNNRFHHSHKGIMAAWGEINELSLRSGTHFDIKRVHVDDYFYHYVGKFDRNKSPKNISKYIESLEDKFTKGNVFLRKSEEGLTSIDIIKVAVIN